MILYKVFNYELKIIFLYAHAIFWEEFSDQVLLAFSVKETFYANESVSDECLQ